MAPLQPASTTKTGLLMIDTQVGLNTSNGFYGSERSTPGFEANVSRILSSFRTYNASVAATGQEIYIAHVFHESRNPQSPLHPSSEGVKFMTCATPAAGEPVVSKSVNGAFVDTPLEGMLREQGLRQLIVCGIATDHCVSTTTRMAADLGIVDGQGGDLGSGEVGIVAIVSDATATFNRGRFDAETVHEVNLASLNDEFAKVVSTDEMLKSILG